MNTSKKIIAVVGATGAQGGGVVKALAERGTFRVRALTRDPSKAERLIRQPPYTVAELEQMAQGDMIVTLEDFLRRRTELAMVHDIEAMGDARGLWRACEVLFGDAAEERWREYFGQPPPGQVEASVA